ncbi:hypothetical protein [Streptomyces sp. ME19-01-6]|uniref:hypothetical protein n=1 Tax=Streptomyces sp. ME19-01-6 TaxID=3028686 RepID=UPI0029A2B1E9|nr:hypothetical protein [Streptomyces sp. ME19-01-6]MDX3230019.1 hypothetical protein [Streptomyces sp. ME19-01-6]
MTDSVPVRCPACRREQSFTPPTYPCSCGAPLTLPVLREGTPEEIEHRTWKDTWVAASCALCGRQGHWPRPEFGCVCGALVRVPVASAPGPTERAPAPARGGGPATPAAAPPSRAVLRPAFRPVTIRTARDAVTAAAQYLTWLGFGGVRRPEGQEESGVDLCGPGVVAQVDPTTRPTALRDIECLWLNGLNESAVSVFFSLAGYARDARARADALHMPLFIMDLTGTPQPVNDPADALIRVGPPER